MMLVTPPAFVVDLVAPWASLYADSKVVTTVVTFAHVGGLLVGGGIAIAADRSVLRASDGVSRQRVLDELTDAHRSVIGALAAILLSGALLAAADLEAHWASKVYWMKMLLVGLLLANGYRMRRIESRMIPAGVDAGHWSSLRGAAATSVTLWLLTTLAGVALVNFA